MSAAGTRLAELIASDRTEAERRSITEEQIEVVAHLNGRRIDHPWTIQRAILEAFEAGAGKHCILREDVDKGGDRVVHHRLGLSITVYP